MPNQSQFALPGDPTRSTNKEAYSCYGDAHQREKPCYEPNNANNYRTARGTPHIREFSSLRNCPFVRRIEKRFRRLCYECADEDRSSREHEVQNRINMWKPERNWR